MLRSDLRNILLRLADRFEPVLCHCDSPEQAREGSREFGDPKLLRAKSVSLSTIMINLAVLRRAALPTSHKAARPLSSVTRIFPPTSLFGLAGFRLPQLGLTEEGVRSHHYQALYTDERQDHLIAQIEQPGLAKENIEISLDECVPPPSLSSTDQVSSNVLTVSGHTTLSSVSESAPEERHSSYSSFMRTFSVPEGLQEDEIKAVLKEEEGVLRLTLPKVPREPKVKKAIEIVVEKGDRAKIEDE